MFKRCPNNALTALVFTMLCLFVSASDAAAQTGDAAAKNQTERQFNPCDVLKQGGTVYDSSQCDELLNKGMTFLRNKAGGASTLFMLAGKRSEWKLTSKNKEAVLAGTKVLLRNKANRSKVAEAIADASGRFALTIPANLEGEVEIVTAQHSVKQGDNEGFCFRLLPQEKHTLCEMHVEDVPFDICLRVVKGRSTRP